MISDIYSRTSPGETLTAPFLQPSTLTSGAYSGQVEIIVSGTGNAYGTSPQRAVDAFYAISTGQPLDQQFYQLNIGWAGAPLFPLAGESRNINNFITFIDGIGEVSSPTTPAYSSIHLYHFVVTVPNILSNLAFGVSDRIFQDNSGSYQIQLWQLSAIPPVPEPPPPQPTGSVPEPGSMALMLLGGLCLLKRRSRKST